MKMETDGYVLDYLPTGKATDRTFEPIAQVIGDRYFTLLEVIVAKGANIKIEEKIGIGKENREKIEKIRRRIYFQDLTSTAKSTLPKAIEQIVRSRENEFVQFFNTSRPVTLRQHQLELLPGVGKKHLKEILNEREKEPFKSFDDIKKRISLIPHPINMLVERIMIELEGRDKYYLFVRPPPLTGEEEEHPRPFRR